MLFYLQLDRGVDLAVDIDLATNDAKPLFFTMDTPYNIFLTRKGYENPYKYMTDGPIVTAKSIPVGSPYCSPLVRYFANYDGNQCDWRFFFFDLTWTKDTFFSTEIKNLPFAPANIKLTYIPKPLLTPLGDCLIHIDLGKKVTFQADGGSPTLVQPRDYRKYLNAIDIILSDEPSLQPPYAMPAIVGSFTDNLKYIAEVPALLNLKKQYFRNISTLEHCIPVLNKAGKTPEEMFGVHSGLLPVLEGNMDTNLRMCAHRLTNICTEKQIADIETEWNLLPDPYHSAFDPALRRAFLSIFLVLFGHGYEVDEYRRLLGKESRISSATGQTIDRISNALKGLENLEALNWERPSDMTSNLDVIQMVREIQAEKCQPSILPDPPVVEKNGFLLRKYKTKEELCKDILRLVTSPPVWSKDVFCIRRKDEPDKPWGICFARPPFSANYQYWFGPTAPTFLMEDFVAARGPVEI